MASNGNLNAAQKVGVVLMAIAIVLAEEYSGFGLGLKLGRDVSWTLAVISSAIGGFLAAGRFRWIGLIAGAGCGFSGFYAVVWYVKDKTSVSSGETLLVYAVAALPIILLAFLIVYLAGGFKQDKSSASGPHDPQGN